MANANKPNGFIPKDETEPGKYVLAASQTIAVGDLVTFDSAGRVIIATATSAKILGAAASSCSSSSAGDTVYVYDNPDTIFVAQVSTGALTDPYTSMTLTGAFDIVATTGGMYVNTAASTYDIVQTIRPGTDPVTHEESAVGAYQRMECRINRAKHCLGGVA